MNIFIGIPCYAGNLHANFVQSLMKMSSELVLYKIPHKIEYITTESLISRARNTLTAMFYSNPNYTHFLFLDADLVFHPLAILSLIKSNKQLSGCPYPKKKINWAKAKSIMDDDDKDIEKNLMNITDINYNLNSGNIPVENTMMEARDVPTGFMLIKRSVITALMLNYPERKFHNNVAGYEESMNECFYDFFGTGVVNGFYLSEDYYFCYLCREINIRCWLETGFTFGHIGQNTFYGNLSSQVEIFGIEDRLNLDKQLLSKLD